jgi:hypothetical protein
MNNYGAYITVKFKCPYMCDDKTLMDENITFDGAIRYILQSEGILAIADEEYEIISIEKFLE